MYENLSREQLIEELSKEKAKNARKFLSLCTDVEIWEGYDQLVIVNTKTGDRKYYSKDQREKDNYYYNFQEDYPEAKTLAELRQKAIDSDRKFNPSLMYGCNGYKRLKAVENSLEDEKSIFDFFKD
jgi:hypothetical protein